MSREAQVRFCERAVVKLRRASPPDLWRTGFASSSPRLRGIKVFPTQARNLYRCDSLRVIKYALAENSRARCKSKVGRCFRVIAVLLGIPREAVVSPAYHLHPEFGLLCPSRRFPRKASVALALLAFLAIVGALVVSHDPDTDAALIAHRDLVRSDVETLQTGGRATAATIAESSPPLEASATACGGDPSSHIGVQCSVGRARKLRSPRAANEAAMIATLPLGRTAPPAPTSPAAPLNPEDAANINIATPAVADSTGPPAPALKKVRKPSRRNGGHDLSRDRRWRDDRWSARAYALPDNRYLRGPYERSWGWSSW